MRNYLYIPIMFIIMILSSGCNSENNNKEINSLDFSKINAIYTVNNFDDAASILLYAESEKTLAGVIPEVFNQVEKIELLGENSDKLVFDRHNFEWQICDTKILRNGIVLRLYLKNIHINEPNMVINCINIVSSDYKYSKEVGEVYISVKDNEDVKGLSVMEAPIVPKNNLEVGKNYNYSYKILDKNGIIKNKVKASLLFREDIKEYIEIGEVSIEPDEITEKEVCEIYKDILTSKELENLHIYNVSCDYKLLKKCKLLFQPTIQIKNRGVVYDLLPFEGMCFFL